jgi:hypothetical protein
MKSYNSTRALRAAAIGIAVAVAGTTARADVKDYEFQLEE